MTKEVSIDTLRQWLDDHRQIAVLDVRSREERAQWWIPESTHVDAYEALRTGQPGPLATLRLPADQPVVTVCSAGRVSRTAADILSARGFDACSLTGGMNAWSMAWNVAEAHICSAGTRVLQVRRTGKGCLSYLIGSGDEAAVIDAALPTDVYLTLAQDHGWRIRYVLDTHIHADHLSRGRRLAGDVGATLLLPAQPRVHFPHSALGHGDRITVGSAALVAHRTPGHTIESTSYVLNDHAVFTGDTLFIHGVGRPDLHADEAAARRAARDLFRSLSELRALAPSIVVLPGHGNEPIPFDGNPIAASLQDVDQWLSTWLSSEDGFLDRVLSRLPPTPPNFARIVGLNERGEFPADGITNLEAGANRCAVA